MYEVGDSVTIRKDLVEYYADHMFPEMMTIASLVKPYAGIHTKIVTKYEHPRSSDGYAYRVAADIYGTWDWMPEDLEPCS